MDEIACRGHPNVLAKHRTTLEVTTENYLTKRGDCIICVEASKGANSLSVEVKGILKSGGYGYLVVKTQNFLEIVHGRGSPELTMTSPVKFIVRRSSFISDATVMIGADKSAGDLRRELVNELKGGGSVRVFLVASELPLSDDEILGVIVDSRPPLLMGTKSVNNEGSTGNPTQFP